MRNRIVIKGSDMIQLVVGDIFDTNCLTVVNPVNCIGYMGKGLAKEFAKRHPEILPRYKMKTKCRRTTKTKKSLVDCNNSTPYIQLAIGNVYKETINPHNGNYSFILMLPTKIHFKDKSKYSYIKDGIRDIISRESSLVITSIALPLLGTGLGGLDKKKVLRLMLEGLTNSRIPNIEIYVDEELLSYGNKLLNKI